MHKVYSLYKVTVNKEMEINKDISKEESTP